NPAAAEEAKLQRGGGSPPAAPPNDGLGKGEGKGYAAARPAKPDGIEKAAADKAQVEVFYLEMPRERWEEMAQVLQKWEGAELAMLDIDAEARKSIQLDGKNGVAADEGLRRYREVAEKATQTLRANAGAGVGGFQKAKG